MNCIVGHTFKKISLQIIARQRATLGLKVQFLTTNKTAPNRGLWQLGLT